MPATRTVSWPDDSVVASLAAVRDHAPLTYGLTNYIAAPLSANLLLAAGASPAIGGALEPSARHFAAIAQGVWINLAALTSDTPQVILAAAESAGAANTPWVLDPVTVGAGAAANDALAAQLLALRPRVVRGNASEVVALAGAEGGTKGVDSTLTPDEAGQHAQELARRIDGIVAVSGPVDLITDGRTVVRVPGGHVNLTRVTGVGCSLGGLVAAFTASVDDPLLATVAAHAVLAHAAERAAAKSRGTGSFAAALLDEVSVLGSPG